jgi:glycosyltransferase involved in cell wall biosynthesis
MKVALVHDFLREYGGAERVLENLHQIYPQAPVYTAFLDKQALGHHWSRFKDWDLRQTWFSKLPFHKKIYSPLRFLAPNAFSDLDLSGFDLVISSSNAFMAKGVKVPNGTHVCYCHTPPRALYGYSTMSNWKKNPLIRVGGQIINHYMRVVDFKLSQQVDYFIANSRETKQRITKFYKRDAEVIYPPVKVKQIRNRVSLENKADYYFYIGRLGLQKHPELAVQACNQLGVKLKVAGTGQMMPKLKELAGETIEFLGAVTDAELWQLYSQAKALLYPVEDEDFGIVPIEAMAAGTPVIAHHSGGPKETISLNKTGLFIDSLTVEALRTGIEQSRLVDWDYQQISQQALNYSQEKFKQRIEEFLTSATS